MKNRYPAHPTDRRHDAPTMRRQKNGESYAAFAPRILSALSAGPRSTRDLIVALGQITMPHRVRNVLYRLRAAGAVCSETVKPGRGGTLVSVWSLA